MLCSRVRLTGRVASIDIAMVELTMAGEPLRGPGPSWLSSAMLPGADIESNEPAAVLNGTFQKSVEPGEVVLSTMFPPFHHNQVGGDVLRPLALSISTSRPLALRSCAFVVRVFIDRCTKPMLTNRMP